MTDNTIDLDADPRPAEHQATDFFARPGDYHQVRIEVPEATNAECVIKFTPEQQPLIVETLRQIRGALGGRITITKLEQRDTGLTTECPLTGTCPSDCDRTPSGCRNRLANIVEHESIYTAQRALDREAERRRIADQHGVPVECVHPAASPTGNTAYTITPPTRDTGGRHARPEPTDPRITPAAIHLARRENWRHSLMQTTIRTDAPTEYRCSCGETLTAATEEDAGKAYEQHRRENTWLDPNNPRIMPPYREHFADQIHDAAYDGDDR